MDSERTESAAVVGLDGVEGRRHEVEVRPSRRRFPAAYKLKILEEIERSPGHGGAILRREGLYSSHLTAWRRQRREGTLRALGSKRGGKGPSPAEQENAKLRREIERLRRELEKAEVIIDAPKKLAELLGVDLPKIAKGSGEEKS